MKIAVVSDYYQPIIGYGKVAITTELAKHHQVKIISSDRYFPFHNYQNTVQSQLGSRYRASGTKKEKNIEVVRGETKLEFFARNYFSGLEVALRDFQPELVIVFGVASPSAVRCSMIKKELGFALVMADSHLFSEYYLGSPVAKVAKSAFYFIYRQVFNDLIQKNTDIFIAMQSGTVDVMRDVYGITAHIDIVENATDVDVFTFSSSARKKLRARYKVKKDNVVLLYTGKLIAQKGVHLLCKSFADLAKKHQKVWCILVGSGEEQYLRSCRKLLSASAAKRFIVIPAQPPSKLFEYYSMADIGVWPLQESLAMVDAAACQLPFIANDGIGTQVRFSNDNALKYRKGSVLSLTNTLETLISDARRRKAMGKRGRSLVESKLLWKHQAKHFIPNHLQ